MDDDTSIYVEYGKTGDPALFRSLFEKFKRPVMSTLIRVGRFQRAEAEDLLQDIFMKVIEQRRRFRPEAKFSTWLYRVAMNGALNRLRDRKPTEPVNDALPDTTLPGPLSDAEASERKGVLDRALAALNPRQRAAIVLREFEGHTYQEIAEILETSLEAVESLLFHSRGRLRALLQGREL